MSEVTLALIDDRLLVTDLLEDLTRPRNVRFATTSYWYYRACRAAVVGAGGQLSGPFSQVDAERQERAILEATASAATLGATIWLSPAAAQGILPEVLDAEGLAWIVTSPQ